MTAEPAEHCSHCTDPDDPRHADPNYAEAEADCAFYENPENLRTTGPGHKHPKDAAVSTCCSAPVRVAGRTTRYYICSKCEKACDGIDEDADRAWHEMVALGQELQGQPDADRR